MYTNSEAANALAVRCLCTTAHMQAFTGNGNDKRVSVK